VGYAAGLSYTTGSDNSFFGMESGHSNTSGNSNSFIGVNAGYSNTEGNDNTFIGRAAGYNNLTGNENTYIGRTAGGGNIGGSGNVCLGHRAGYNENGSNKLYIANTDTSEPLIYGEFDNQYLEVNGRLRVNSYIQLAVTGGSTPPSEDCDDQSEYGRMLVDEINEGMYVCVSSGWALIKAAKLVKVK
jgi:hypothetical protein